jgi:hypothetical protein
MVDVRQPGNHLAMQMVAEPLPGLMDHELSILTMVVAHPMVVEIEPLLGLREPRPQPTACSRMALLLDPRLQDMEVVVIPGDQRRRHTSILLQQMIIGDPINQPLADGAETFMMHRLLERICQRLHLRL